tara:strand:- start:136 stop:351 length:216 start_codon:yes stop_codon:yes gene_type:complete
MKATGLKPVAIAEPRMMRTIKMATNLEFELGIMRLELNKKLDELEEILSIALVDRLDRLEDSIRAEINKEK